MSADPALAPVEITITQRCAYKAKPCKACGKPKSNPLHRKRNVEEGLPFCEFKRRVGCASCGAARRDPLHMGAPPALQVLGSGNPRLYQAIKEQWEALLFDRLTEAGLPKGLERIVVEGEATFPDRQRRDQGNFRVLLEKALGDTLTNGGWLEDDDWTRYEFGGLAYRYEPGVSRTRLMLFPSVPIEREQTLFAAVGCAS